MRPHLGTYVEIELHSNAPEHLIHTWMTAGFEAVAEVDRVMSYRRPDSDLTQLNEAAPGVWVDIHPHTAKVLEASNEFFNVSRGAFDIRCGAMLAEHGVLPAPAGRLSHAALPKDTPPVEVHGRRVRKTGAWLMDLGGIAKGFAVDRAVARIRGLAAGFRLSGVVNAGGDLRVWGEPMAPTTVAIRGRRASRSWPLPVSRTSMATSSVRSHPDARLTASAHIDVRRGCSLTKEQTVTVFARQCLQADALTKVLTVAPRKIAARCLSAYKARGLVFGPGGRLKKAIA